MKGLAVFGGFDPEGLVSLFAHVRAHVHHVVPLNLLNRIDIFKYSSCSSPGDMQTKRNLLGDNSEKLARLNALYDVVMGCRKCPGLNLWTGLSLTSSLAVFGAGNVDAELFFIGQSACLQCQETGWPFTKGSGDLLDSCLENIRITREQVFISNVVHCHPPNNRPSKSEEVENCRPYLGRELSIVRPKLIVTLGLDAARWFKPEIRSIMKCAGQPFETLLFTIYPLPHPVVPYRQPSLEPEYMSMFRRIPDVLEKVERQNDL